MPIDKLSKALRRFCKALSPSSGATDSFPEEVVLREMDKLMLLPFDSEIKAQWEQLWQRLMELPPKPAASGRETMLKMEMATIDHWEQTHQPNQPYTQQLIALARRDAQYLYAKSYCYGHPAQSSPYQYICRSCHGTGREQSTGVTNTLVYSTCTVCEGTGLTTY